MANLPLTLALEHYDRHVPFFEGSVAPEGVDLQVRTVGQVVSWRDGRDRHERVLAGEFDAGELSLSSYLIARDRGAPLTAIPIFPRRLFSLSRIYVNAAAGIERPSDLVGRRVGLNSFQTTLSVLARGDLQADYGVPWREITWVTSGDEAMPLELPAGPRVERLAAGESLGDALLSGALDAVALPHPPHAVQSGDPRVRRLFPDAMAEDRAYYARHGYWPIMHLVAVKNEIVAAHPWLPLALMGAFTRARELAWSYWEDPNWSLMAWGRFELEAQRQALGGDPWRDGLAANRANLDCFIGYSHEQGLIRQRLPVDDLFAAATLGT